MNQPIPPVIARACHVILVAAIIGYGLLALAVVEMAVRGGVPHVAFDGTASFSAERVLSANVTLTGMGAEVHLGAQSISVGYSLAVQGGGRLRIGESYSAYGSAQMEGDLLARLLRVGGSLDIDPRHTSRAPGRYRMAIELARLRTSSGCRARTIGGRAAEMAASGGEKHGRSVPRALAT
jgi:hypothetical protein